MLQVKVMLFILVGLLVLSCTKTTNAEYNELKIESLELNSNILVFSEELICSCSIINNSDSLNYSWFSNIDGVLESNISIIKFQPRNYIGIHTLVCTVEDNIGNTAQAEVYFEVKPPESSLQYDLSEYFPLNINNEWIYGSYYDTHTALLQDTVINQNADLSFIMKQGIFNYPPNSYYYTNYLWENDGLYKTIKVNDSSSEDSISVKRLILKRFAYNNEEWFSNKENYIAEYEKFHKINIIDSLCVNNSGWSYDFIETFYNVVLFDDKYYYAKDVGYIGSKSNDLDTSFQELLFFKVYD